MESTHRAEVFVRTEYLRHPTMSVIRREVRGEFGDHRADDPVVRESRLRVQAKELVEAHRGVLEYALSKARPRDREAIAGVGQVFEMGCISAVFRPESEELFRAAWTLALERRALLWPDDGQPGA